MGCIVQTKKIWLREDIYIKNVVIFLFTEQNNFEISWLGQRTVDSAGKNPPALKNTNCRPN